MKLTPLNRTETPDHISYDYVKAELRRADRRVEILISCADSDAPADAAGISDQGVDYWPLAVTRELDDLILRLRTNERTRDLGFSDPR